MSRVFSVAALMVCLAACGGDISFPPPPQRAAMNHSVAHPVEIVLGMSEEQGDTPWASIVDDVLPPAEGTNWRWAREHPSFRFDLLDNDGWEAKARITTVEKVLEKTGPQHVTMSVNGSAVGKATLSAPGQYDLAFPVDTSLVNSAAPVILRLDIEPCLAPPSGSKDRLCLLLQSVAFVRGDR